ncbi:ABC transporter substrate-binding protein [Maridesulfovibrio frigidus]|uniref:ABC transporter substrate-binding protein n=1 Tax=Maridesulfovibrio frigidus TaxID=340956 RepID=UPI00068A8062|nr:ABC transporter substrate-binding protein [Maridesulfovibrio frigidus]
MIRLKIWTIIKQMHCMLFFIFVLFSACSLTNLAYADKKLESVTLQLKWFHQFQFAGYYAALEKGFYEDEGLDVTILERDLKFNPVDQVLNGSADFGVTNSELLLHYLKGKPVVLLSSIFQHSPLVFLSKTSPLVHSPHGFFGKKVLMNSASQDIELRSMLQREEISLNEIDLIDKYASPEDYLDPDIDIIAAYITNEPYYLNINNIPYSTIYPSTYGVDFYGDSLFTSLKRTKKNPDQVRRFVRASLKGWKYALEHQSELIEIIINKFGSLKSKNHLIYEAGKVKELISADLVKIGHTNPGRWQSIANSFEDLEMISNSEDFSNFFFDPNVGRYEIEKNTVTYISLLFLLFVVILFFMLALTRKLKIEVNTRIDIEERLKKSEQYYRSLFQNTGAATIIINENMLIKHCNDNFAILYGRKREDIEKTITLKDFVADEDIHRICRYHEARSRDSKSVPNRYDFKFVSADGEFKNIHVYIDLISGSTDRVASLIDMTEKVKTQEILIQTEKMISVGGLAAGMAHEINNPLAGILHGSQNILRRLSPDYKNNTKIASDVGCTFEDINSYLEQRGVLRMIRGIQSSGERAAEIVKNMLEFSRRSDSGRTSCDLNSIFEDTIDIVSCDYDLIKKYDFKHTQIIRDYAEESHMVSCFKTEIEQVLLNLIKNAAYAMYEISHQRSPKLTLRTKVEKEFIIIEVEDNGPGMPEDVRKRVFEPFFTTKLPGSGTGLGLSVSYFIITQNHKGLFEVESEVGKGTKFSIKLPRIRSIPIKNG